jgi:hypothetical protein
MEWKQLIPSLLGKDWVLKSVTHCAFPVEWERTAGDDGIAIQAENPQVTDTNSRGTFHPTFALFIMPKGWQGRCRLQPGGLEAVQAQSATEIGTDSAYHRFFYVMDGDPHLVYIDNIIQHYSLKKATPPVTVGPVAVDRRDGGQRSPFFAVVGTIGAV